MIGIIQRRRAAKRFDEGPIIATSSTYPTLVHAEQIRVRAN